MSQIRESMALPAGAAVGRYRLREVQTSWGFYLVYAARDADGKEVLVHELLPEELAQRGESGGVIARHERAQEGLAWARDRFLLEGRTLAAHAQPGVQKVLNVFEANGTAYWVTLPDETRTVKRWMQDLGRAPTESELRRWLVPLLTALEKIHAAGLHHLNLKPDTIQLTPDDQPVLVHFAGSRRAIARHSHEASAVTAGYSPPEQYDLDQSEGAWTDLYSLAAILYRAIAGQAPPEADGRLESDPYAPLTGRFAAPYSERFLKAIDAALAVKPKARPQTAAEWRRMFGISGIDTALYQARQNPRTWAVVVAGLCVAVAAAWWLRPEPKPVPDPADEIAKKEPEKDTQKKAADEQQQQEKEQTKEKEEPKKEEEKTKEDPVADSKEAMKSEEEKMKVKEEEAKQAVEKHSAEMAAQKAAEEKAAAEKQAAEMAARKAAEEKAAVEKQAAEMAAQKAAEEKAAAEKQAAEMAARKAAAEKAAVEKQAAEMAAQKAAEEKAAAKKQAAELAARKAAQEKAQLRNKPPRWQRKRRRGKSKRRRWLRRKRKMMRRRRARLHRVAEVPVSRQRWEEA